MTVDETLPKNKKVRLDKSKSDEGRQITDEDYKNDLRHKPISVGLYSTTKGVERNQQLFQVIHYYTYFGIQILNRNPIVLNEERITIVAYIVQLIVNCFEAESHAQKDQKRRVFEKHIISENKASTMLPKSDNTLLDGILVSVPDFSKVYQPKK